VHRVGNGSTEGLVADGFARKRLYTESRALAVDWEKMICKMG
jgi:hypothetical protein